MTVNAQFTSQATELAKNADAIVTFKLWGVEIVMPANDHAALMHEVAFGDNPQALREALGCCLAAQGMAL